MHCNCIERWYLVVFALPLENNAISCTRLRQTTMYIVDFAFYWIWSPHVNGGDFMYIVAFSIHQTAKILGGRQKCANNVATVCDLT